MPSATIAALIIFGTVPNAFTQSIPGQTLTPQSQVEISFGMDPLLNQDAPIKVSMKSVKIREQPNPPNYPTFARLQGIQGDVLVEVWVNKDGLPYKSKTIWGSKEFDDISAKYALTWKFEPLLISGSPVPFRVRFVMPYRLAEGRPVKTIPNTFLW